MQLLVPGMLQWVSLRLRLCFKAPAETKRTSMSMDVIQAACNNFFVFLSRKTLTQYTILVMWLPKI